MKPKELALLLQTTIPNKLPILIKGAPGVGKSDIVAQATKLAKAQIVLMHPVVSDPTDFKGLPAIVDQEAEFLPFGDLRTLIQCKGPTVAFLDDLGQAPAVVQAAAMQLILARRVNGHKVSDDVVFIAATNRREDRAGVTGILEPVKSRFASIVELAPDLEDWCEWALANDVPHEVVAFVRFRPKLFLSEEKPTADIINRPCPRTITHLGRLYRHGIRSIEALGGAAGMGFATEFVAYVRIYENLPSVDQIFIDPAKAKVPEEPAALYAVATAVAARVTKDTASRAMKYLCRLPQEFQVLGVRDGVRQCKLLAACKEFLVWMNENKEVIL